QLLQSLQSNQPGLFERLTTWMRRPVSWAIAAGVMAVLIMGVLIRQSRPPAQYVAISSPPTEVRSSPAPPPPPRAAESRRGIVSTRPLRDAVRSENVANALAPAKMKLAVLDFDSSREQ